ncbi:phospholipase D family protein [Gilliamella sp. W8126]|uniref:phospholipase D family protein n=1 Tax=Gilliamella sp. W8126 TaxID=2750946 RepID=UPI0018DBD188|nr:phospholipase D family protein [Gilliamella sp. W8126]MBI0006342.1 phospholipase D family protein [Gilliamella sp. W8126]
MELINQPFTGQLGNRLIELLGSSDYHTLNIVVAFAKNSGILRIKNALDEFRKRGGLVNVYVGVDLGGTSYEALTALLLHSDSLNVVHSEKGQTFHTKIYQFLGKDKALIVIGSHNLTGGGLWTNFESSVLIPINRSNTYDRNILKWMDDYFKQLKSLKDSFMLINTKEDIDKLLQNGYVCKEIAEQIRLIKTTTQDKARECLFGNGTSAKLPSIASQKNEKIDKAVAAQINSISVILNDEAQTIWFETKKLTGGSRNILDLSMKSLVERGDPTGTPFDLGESKFMRGGVEFFGLNPTVTNKNKNITLNFEGIDYAGNTILFPVGEKANGTWRLQIKGSSSSQIKITDAFRKKGETHYLVEKIITFTKIEDDYYVMSIFPESELENFKAASRILARNGSTRTAKQLGLL